jgi:hypothetical protein
MSPLTLTHFVALRQSLTNLLFINAIANISSETQVPNISHETSSLPEKFRHNSQVAHLRFRHRLNLVFQARGWQLPRLGMGILLDWHYGASFLLGLVWL